MWRARNLLVALVILAGCRSSLPWAKEEPRSEVNMAFLLDHNLVRLQTTTINGHPGSHVFSSALPRSVIDTRLAGTLGPAGRKGYLVTMGEKQSRSIQPVIADLSPAADAILGSDMIGRHSVTIDYATGLVTYQSEGIFTGLMTLYSFTGAPEVTVNVNGRELRAIVDTASPETLILPGPDGREAASVQIAGSDLGTVDIRRAPVSQARIGNRLLVNFLVSIDYRKRIVGMYRDRRAQGAAPVKSGKKPVSSPQR